MKTTESYDVGVIIGRFQVPDLHDAHREIFEHVCSQHGKVLVFLGVSPLWVTQENPLDFEARKQMILAAYPNVNVFYIRDVHNDDLWSKNLDDQIEHVLSPAQNAVLYGGRDSFINHYTGRYPTREFQQETWVSGTEVRKQISRRSTKASADFRAGVIWAASNRYPTAYPTVDVAIFNNESRTKVLLGRKPNEKQFRFIGGFATPESACYEDDAEREVMEEAGVKLRDIRYLASFKIDDWRYRPEIDKIKTLFFEAFIVGNDPKPGDDIAEVKWFLLHEIKQDDIVSTHRSLLSRLLAKHLE
jgi:bifunctional NMN adenylyltransferase/nudix hydrolase